MDSAEIIYSSDDDEDDEDDSLSVQVTPQASTKRKHSETFTSEDQLNKYIRLDEDHDLIPNSSSFVCVICATEVDDQEGVVLRNCLHEFCKECLSSCIEHCDDAEVLCPYVDEDYSCRSFLQTREVRASVSTELFEKHLKKSLEQAESVLTTFHCKSLNCPAFCEHDGEYPEFVCYLCHRINCIRCDACHENQTCDQYQDMMAQLTLSTDSQATEQCLTEDLAAGRIKKCPGCHILITRNGGCFHMTCKCGVEFQWGLGLIRDDDDEDEE